MGEPKPERKGAGEHWREKIERGLYPHPSAHVKTWQKRYVELLQACVGVNVVKEADLPWMQKTYLGNRFVHMRFTGKTLYIQLISLEKFDYITMTRDEDLKKGFFGIVGIHVPQAHVRHFDACPIYARSSTKRLYEKAGPEKMKKAWKTVDNIWRTFGMAEKVNEDGSILFTFQNELAEVMSRRHKKHSSGRKLATSDDSDGEEEGEDACASDEDDEDEEAEGAARPKKRRSFNPAQDKGQDASKDLEQDASKDLEMLASIANSSERV